MPSKLPANNAGRFSIVNSVLGICNRTVAVSKGYFTRVLTVDTADPETNPEMLSWNAVGIGTLLLLSLLEMSARELELMGLLMFDLMTGASFSVCGIEYAGDTAMALHAAVAAIQELMNPLLEHDDDSLFGSAKRRTFL